MSSLTPNFNLIKPDANDLFELFRQWYNDNLDIIDANLGGGSGGHIIVDPNGSDMPAEGKLQFTGNVNVTDDNVNGKTVVDIPTSSGSGHTIIDQNGVSMTQRSGLQFVGANVIDDAVNNKTVVTVTGGNGINYSLTEQVIGTWKDGKPLYQITFEYNGTINANTATNLVNISSLNVESMVTLFGSIYESGWGWEQVPTNNFRLHYNTNSGYIEAVTGAFAVSGTCNVTLSYTKTTD